MNTLIEVKIQRTHYDTVVFDLKEIAENYDIALDRILEITPDGPGICITYTDDQGEVHNETIYTGDAEEYRENDEDYDCEVYDIDQDLWTKTLKQLQDPLYKMVKHYEPTEKILYDTEQMINEELQ